MKEEIMAGLCVAIVCVSLSKPFSIYQKLNLKDNCHLWCSLSQNRSIDTNRLLRS